MYPNLTKKARLESVFSPLTQKDFVTSLGSLCGNNYIRVSWCSIHQLGIAVLFLHAHAIDQINNRKEHNGDGFHKWFVIVL
jgi:hypothetical protein